MINIGEIDVKFSIRYLLSPNIRLRFSDLRGCITKDESKTIKVTYICEGFPIKGNLHEMFQIEIENRLDKLNVSIKGKVKYPNLSK